MDQRLSGYDCDLIDDVGAFAALEAEWDALNTGSEGYLSQSYEWARLCLGRLDAADRLCCAVLRRHGRMEALLPLVVSRRGVSRVARPLASPSNEYCPLLFGPSVEVAGALRSFWTAVSRRGDVDAVLLTYVRDDSALGAWLRDCPHATWIRSTPAPFLDGAEFGSWERYHAQLPHKVQTNLRRNWRRIRQLGEVIFEELTDPAEMHAAWQWMISQKREWMKRRGLENQWIPSDDYFNFIAATLGLKARAGRRSIFALKLDGRLIAAELVNIDQRRVEMFVVTYDPALGQCAPGNLLRGEVLRWAFARGLDYDWRVGGDAYKAEWANRACEALTYVLALNGRGRIFAAYVAGRAWLAERIPDRLRAQLRPLIRRAY
jgi:CelD/BcsL family acetyltransferase involved in cellulose biosynthesis